MEQEVLCHVEMQDVCENGHFLDLILLVTQIYRDCETAPFFFHP